MIKFNTKVFNEDNYFASVRYPNGIVDAFHVYCHMGKYIVFDHEFDFVCQKQTYEQVQKYLNDITNE